MENTIFTFALVSALKRKQPKEILVELLKINGKDEEAEEARNAGRFTAALIDRTVKSSLPVEAEEEVVDEELLEVTEPVVEIGETAETNELIAIHEDIEALIGKGKRKKAIKLIKASMANGTKGSVIEKQLKRAKKLEK